MNIKKIVKVAKAKICTHYGHCMHCRRDVLFKTHKLHHIITSRTLYVISLEFRHTTWVNSYYINLNTSYMSQEIHRITWITSRHINYNYVISLHKLARTPHYRLHVGLHVKGNQILLLISSYFINHISEWINIQTKADQQSATSEDQ